MEQNIVETPHLLNAWAWVEKNKKQVGLGAAAVAAVGLVIGYSMWARAEKEEAASHALSHTLYTAAMGRGVGADTVPFQKVASEHEGTKAGMQAQLFAAGALFSAGKYSEAQVAFERFAQEHAANSLAAQALYGAGVALEAQGKPAEAANAYKNILSRFPSAPIAPQTRYALAGILATQGDLKGAVELYDEVARGSMGTSLANEASLRADDLRAKLPPPPAVAAPLPATNAPTATP
jgi:TolA-binding protein